MKKNLFVAIILTLCICSSSFALYGTRPMGMGGAFTAIADDANAAYWNPAGFAINPGIDITGSLLANNRNESIGDNIASLKMCFETELNPFAWIIGVGAMSLVALDGAKYLSDQGILKKNWGRDKESNKKEESVSQKVLESGSEKTVAVGQKAKEAAKATGRAALETATETGRAIGETVVQEFARESARQVYWGPYQYPWYHRYYNRPTYWDRREAEYAPQGKAQFAAGITWLTDKNSVANQNTNFYTLSLATGYEERVAIGGNLNFYDITIPSPNNIKGYGGGIDLGILLRPADQLAFGATAKEIMTTDVRFENGAIIRYEMNINAGVALTPIDVFTVSADLHNIFKQGGSPQTKHFGAELRPFPGLALRGGLYDESKTAGASIMAGPVIIDYAYLGGAFNRTQMLGATWKI